MGYKGVVLEKVKADFPILGLTQSNQPLHMSYGVISPCSQCLNDLCPRKKALPYKKYSKLMYKLLDINNTSNELPGKNPISLDEDYVEGVVFVYVALAHKNIFFDGIDVWGDYFGTLGRTTVRALAPDVVERIYDSAKQDRGVMRGIGAGVSSVYNSLPSPFMTQEKSGIRKDAEDALEFAKAVRRSTATLWRDVFEKPRFRWDDKEFTKYITCEPFPVQFLFPLKQMREMFGGGFFGGNLLKEKEWLTCIHPGEVVHNGFALPMAMYAKGDGHVLDGLYTDYEVEAVVG